MVKVRNTLDTTKSYINSLRNRLISAETEALGGILASELGQVTLGLNALLKEENPCLDRVQFDEVQIIEGKPANQVQMLVILESMLRLPLGLGKADIYLESMHYLAAAEALIRRLREATSAKGLTPSEVVRALSLLKSRGVNPDLLRGVRNLVVCLPTLQDAGYFAHYFFQSNVICCLWGTDSPESLCHEIGHLLNYRLTDNPKITPQGYQDVLAKLATAGQTHRTRFGANWGKGRKSLTETFADDFAVYLLQENELAHELHQYFSNLLHSLS
ncbi:MAG: hypothetical protein WA118_12355 [Carboxydocellales bacterium]